MPAAARNGGVSSRSVKESVALAIRRIVTVEDENPVLRRVAQPVRRVDGQVRQLMDDMVETMREAPGVGLAAPQVGVGWRVIVVETPVDVADPEGPHRLHALANPEIIWADPAMEEGEEACLSVPGLFGAPPRHVAIRIQGLDPRGRRVEIAARDFEARVFQHEIDHLNGVLFPDRVSGIEKLYKVREEKNGDLVRVPYVIAAT